MSAEMQAKPAKNGREVEWQLAAADLGPVRRWLSDHGRAAGLVLEPRSKSEIFDTYFDTDDWRIHRAGYALRVRSESGKTEATLKSLSSASEEVADRRELTEPVDAADPGAIRETGGPVGARVDAVSGQHDLQPLFEVRTSRQKFAVHAPDEEQPLGEIALDETTISPPNGEPQTSLQRVEVEALTDSLEPLRSLVAVLRSECALEAAHDTKFSEGLKTVGLAPLHAPQFLPTGVDPSMRIDEVAYANLRRYLSAWYLHEPGARLGDDPEALHELRLAGRRLDAILGLFKSTLPGSLVEIRQTLKKVLRALGDARDLDVALSELDSFGNTLSDVDRDGTEPLKKYLAAERMRARARMLSTLDSSTVRRDLEKLASLVAAPAAAGTECPSELIRTSAPELIGARFRKLRKGADRLTSRSSTAEYHRVRGRLKKLRYLLESVAVMYGKPADEMLRAIRRWQDKLGEQQDADVAGRRLKSLAGTPPKGIPPETLFLMGRFAEHYAHAADRARKSHPKAYRKVRGRWKKLKTRLAEAAEDESPRAGSSGS